jgi:general secretion pathway protein E
MNSAHANPDTNADDAHLLRQHLLHHALLGEEALTRAHEAAEQAGVRLSAALTALGLLSEPELARAFADLLGLPVLSRQALMEGAMWPPGMNLEFLRARRLVPLRLGENEQALAMADPLDEDAARAAEFVLGKGVRRYVAQASDIDEVLAGSVKRQPALPERSTAGTVDHDVLLINDRDSDAPVIRQVSRLIAKAADLGASDIHLEAQPDALRVRFRVDGELTSEELLSRRWAEPLVSRLKLMAQLDIAEKRLPQDGRLRTAVRGESLDVRLATLPSLHGENVVLRLLGQRHVSLDLEKIGLPEGALVQLKRALERPHGLILITGPTGSGKTTTLHAALSALCRPQRKLMTVEDPVEYTLPGVSQLQVRADIGLDYAHALRAILRSDPDVIMVGEIRDPATAEIALRAALTGHLVLATLHTNTAAGAVTRLIDLGVEDYLLASTLVLTAAQRLVRVLCPQCKQLDDPDERQRALLRACALDPAGAVSARPRGCTACLWRGYKGRAPLFESITLDARNRTLIRAGMDEAALSRTGDGSLMQHGLALAASGITAFDEVLAVAGESA